MTRILYAGVDFREHPVGSDADWSQDRREKYLLRPEVVRPLSVDPNVWGQMRAPHALAAERMLPWVSPDEIARRAVDVLGAADGRWTLVVVGAVAEDQEEEEALASGAGIQEQLVVEASWEFLGFDVADGSTSGLSNCAYDADQAAVLRQMWASRLNEHGLFSELVDALAFRQLTDERVPEHAPFHVYGLWVVTHVGHSGSP